MTTTTTWYDWVLDYKPCADAMEWIRSQPDAKTAWATCRRGDWMLWLLYSIHGPTRDTPAGSALWRARADCAELALPIYEAAYPGDARVRDCIYGIRAYAIGRIDRDTLDKLVALADGAKSSAWEAWAAKADVAAAGAARAAAMSAAWADGAVDGADVAAAGAARAAARAAAWAAVGAVDGADEAAAWAAAGEAREKVLACCADIVRRHFPEPPEQLEGGMS